MSADRIKRRVCLLRERFGEELRAHLSELVASDDDVDAEIHFLYRALHLPPSQYDLHRH
jgi:hypothetical protein